MSGKKKHVLLAFAAAAILVATCAASSFAASGMNPILSVSYNTSEEKPKISLSVKAPDSDTAKTLERAVLDIGDEAFRFGQESEVKGKLSQDVISAARVSVGDKLYTMKLINGDAVKDEPENAAVSLSYELLPSDESPSDQIETVDHEKTDLVNKELFYVNDEAATAAEYKEAKTNNICREEKSKDTEVTEAEPVTETISFDGKTAQKVNRWVRNRYYHYTKTVTAISRLYILSDKSDKTAASIRNGEHPKASFMPLMAKQKSVGYTEIGLEWNLVDGADEYLVYCSPCGKSNYKRVAETKDQGFTSIRKLKRNTYYKFIVVAVDKRGNEITASSSVHITTKGSHKNPRNLTVKKKALTIKAGKTKTAGAKVNHKGVKVHVRLRYLTDDSSIATVNSKGKIKAKSPGTCNIYVYAQNGIVKSIPVTVK